MRLAVWPPLTHLVSCAFRGSDALQNDTLALELPLAGASVGDLCNEDASYNNGQGCRAVSSCGICVSPETYATYTSDYSECALDELPDDVRSAELICARCGPTFSEGDRYPRLCCPGPDTQPGYVPGCAAQDNGNNICVDSGIEDGAVLECQLCGDKDTPCCGTYTPQKYATWECSLH